MGGFQRDVRNQCRSRHPDKKIAVKNSGKGGDLGKGGHSSGAWDV